MKKSHAQIIWWAIILSRIIIGLWVRYVFFNSWFMDQREERNQAYILKTKTIKTHTIENPITTLSLLWNENTLLNDTVWVGTFITNDWWLITAKHILEENEKIAVQLNKTFLTNEFIHLHPTEDVALMKVLDTKTSCVPLIWKDPSAVERIVWNNFSAVTLEEKILSFTSSSEITPWMSGTPLLSYPADKSTFSEYIMWIVTQRDQTNTKKWQWVFLSPSLLDRIEETLPHDTQDYFTLCNNNETIQ